MCMRAQHSINAELIPEGLHNDSHNPGQADGSRGFPPAPKKSPESSYSLQTSARVFFTAGLKFQTHRLKSFCNVRSNAIIPLRQHSLWDLQVNRTRTFPPHPLPSRWSKSQWDWLILWPETFTQHKCKWTIFNHFSSFVSLSLETKQRAQNRRHYINQINYVQKKPNNVIPIQKGKKKKSAVLATKTDSPKNKTQNERRNKIFPSGPY